MKRDTLKILAILALLSCWVGFGFKGCSGGSSSSYNTSSNNYNVIRPDVVVSTPTPTPNNNTTTNTTTSGTTTTQTTTTTSATQTFNTTATAQACTLNSWMSLFLSDPANKNLQLYIPGYAYYQGVIYSNGNVRTMGPIRVIGGVVCKNSDSSADEKQILMEKGAMLTTNPEYLKKKLSPPSLKLKVTQWEEKPIGLKEIE
ncbi:MAG: hypothetical protein LWY06_10760 [Firmicutes bacterium]|nr:hypothetical protein [Bacillota bacterium]